MTFPSLVIQATAFHTPRRGQVEILENAAIAINAAGVIEAVMLPETDGYDTLVADAQTRGLLQKLGDDDFLIPGLVDLHIHAPQWPQLGKALDAPLQDWLLKYTFPIESRTADSAYAYDVYDDLVQTLLAHGTTTAVYFGSVDYQANIILAEACLRHNQRALVGKVAMDDPEQCPDYYRDPSATAALEDTQRFIKAIRAMQPTDSPLVLPAITPRFIPSCTDELLTDLGALAQQTGCHVQTHCSESDWEVSHVYDRLGKTDTEALNDFGLLTDKTVLAHSNFITDDDMALMAEKGAAVAHCPLSNAYFANAVFPLRKAWEHGVKVGLGTDISGGFSPSIFDNARYALVASRLACRGTAPEKEQGSRGSGETPLTTAEAFWLATAAGGQALSLPIGLFKPGYRFDALSIRSNLHIGGFRHSKNEDSLGDIFEKLVLTADKSCITDIWVNGKSG